MVAIHPGEHTVELDDKSRIYYTKLIYALGSECFIPPIPGTDLPQVTAIRRLDDVRRLEKLMEKSQEAVVIGGGVLGLEAAWELKKSGLFRDCSGGCAHADGKAAGSGVWGYFKADCGGPGNPDLHGSECGAD